MTDDRFKCKHIDNYIKCNWRKNTKKILNFHFKEPRNKNKWKLNNNRRKGNNKISNFSRSEINKIENKKCFKNYETKSMLFWVYQLINLLPRMTGGRETQLPIWSMKQVMSLQTLQIIKKITKNHSNKFNNLWHEKGFLNYTYNLKLVQEDSE